MADHPVIEELARHGDLSLVRSRITGRVGLLRDDWGVPAAPAAAFGRDEWHWVLVCAAPLALQVLPPEPLEEPAVAGQTSLNLDVPGVAPGEATGV